MNPVKQAIRDLVPSIIAEAHPTTMTAGHLAAECFLRAGMPYDPVARDYMKSQIGFFLSRKRSQNMRVYFAIPTRGLSTAGAVWVIGELASERQSTLHCMLLRRIVKDHSDSLEIEVERHVARFRHEPFNAAVSLEDLVAEAEARQGIL